MIETILMCCQQIGFPEELANLLTQFFGNSFKILRSANAPETSSLLLHTGGPTLGDYDNTIGDIQPYFGTC